MRLLNNRILGGLVVVLVALGLGAGFAFAAPAGSGVTRVELRLTGPCANPTLKADGRTWTTGATVSPSWDGLKSVSGEFEFEGDAGTFTSDDDWVMGFSNNGGFVDLSCSIDPRLSPSPD